MRHDRLSRIRILRTFGKTPCEPPARACPHERRRAGNHADVLLAAGASPAMVVAPEESGTFAGIADGLLINIGTPTAERIRAMNLAADAPTKNARPGCSIPWRRAHSLARRGHPIVRRKAPDRHPRECQRNPCARGLFLVRKRSRQLRLIRLGARSRATSRTRVPTVVHVTGETDYVTDGERTVSISGAMKWRRSSSVPGVRSRPWSRPSPR